MKVQVVLQKYSIPGGGTIQLGTHFLDMVTVLCFTESPSRTLIKIYSLPNFFIFGIDIFHPMGDNLELIVEANGYIIIII